MKKKVPVLYPFLFAFYPIFYFYDQNKHEVWFSQTIIPLFFSILVAGIFFFVFHLLTKEKHKTGICVIVFLSLFFSYSAFIDELNKYKIGALILRQDPNLFISYSILLVIVFILTKKSNKDFSTSSYYLNLFSAILILFPLFNISIYKFSVSTSEEKFITDGIKVGSAEMEKQVKPDIYFIILDGYAREDILKDFYGFSNRDFIQFLEKSGFYVGNKSRSNYPVTVPSVFSILNMEYIETNTENMEVNKNEQLNIYEKIENNRVLKFLKSKGYKYIHFTSDARVTDFNKNADETKTASNWISPFTVAFLEKTFLKRLNLSFLDPIKIRQETILYEFDELEEIPKDKSPTFTFAHIMMPHGPMVFDRNGNTPQNTSDSPKGYLEFLKFANKKTKHLVKTIISESETPPVIILQSDHGSENYGECIDPSPPLLKEKMAILNAYYVPEQVREHLYQTITPVNSFRVLFDYYFGTDLGLIEDKVFFTYCYGNIFQPVRVPDEKYLPSSLKEKVSNKKWLESLKEGINRFPNNIPIINTLGKEYFIAGHFKEAEKHLKLVLDSNLAHKAHKLLGKVYYNQEKYQEAAAAFKKSLLLFSEDIDTKFLLALSYFKVENYKKANFYLDELSVLQPKSVDFFALRALVYTALGDVENAIKCYKSVLNITSLDIETHLRIGSAYDEVKDGRTAISHIAIARQLLEKANNMAKAKQVEEQFEKLLQKYNFKASDFADVRIN